MQQDENRKPDRQLWLALQVESNMGSDNLQMENPTEEIQYMERITAPENLHKALKRVQRNKGAAGVDGMTVKELTGYLREHWSRIREELFHGDYRPEAVRQHEIPKSGGGVRTLGIPTVLDRFIQQAILQVLQEEWDPTFSDGSFGFRPNRSAQQAVKRAQEYYQAGYHWVVNLDLEKFFDRVNHDKLMSLVSERVNDWRLKKLIQRYLKVGAMKGDVYSPREEGTPQGGPLSPLLANLLLDQLDKELEKRGLRFVRYADDCNIYVKSRRSGGRVKRTITRHLSRKLKLKVNEEKSSIDRPRNRSFLGFIIARAGRILVSKEAITRFKAHVRGLTSRKRGRHIKQVIAELRVYLTGWRTYFGCGYSKQRFRELSSWIMRRLRSYLWTQWGRRGYRNLREAGVSRQLAWNTSKSAHRPWRISHSPALNIALPTNYFVSLGLPLLYNN